MATININRVSICAANNHVRVSAQVNAGAAREVDLEVSQIMRIVDDAEVKRFIEILLKLYAIGKTANQIRTGLANGITVNI